MTTHASVPRASRAASFDIPSELASEPATRRLRTSERLPACLLAALFLLAAAGAPAPARANEIVLLDFSGGGNNDDEEQGNRKPFKNSTIIQRLDAADATMTAEQIANMMMDDIKKQMEDAYAGKWITFTKDPNQPGITKSIDFVAGVDDTAVPGSFGFFDGNKAWVLPDNFDFEVWIPDSAPGGAERDGKMNKAELTRALAKTAAHELGHMLLGAGHPASKSLTKAGEAADKPLALDPASSTLMAQGTNVFDLGDGADKLGFSKENMKKIEKLIGTSSAKGHKKPKKLKRAKQGDRDAVGTESSETTGRDGRFNPSIAPGLIFGDAGEQAMGTDVLLDAGTLTYELLFPETVGQVDSAFLDLGLYSLAGDLDALSMSFEGVDLTASLSGIDTSPVPSDTDPSGSQVVVSTIDLEDFFTLSELTSFFSDGSAVVELGVPTSAIYAVDFVSVDAFMAAPEPTTASALGIGLISWLFARRGPFPRRKIA